MAWVWQPMSVLYDPDDGSTFTVDVEVQDTQNSDGMIRTVRMTNNTTQTHFAAALYKGAWTPSALGLACPAGQTISINLGNNVKAGDVAEVSVW